MALWTLLQAVLGPVVAFLIGVGCLKRYAVLSSVAAAVSLVLSVQLIKNVGVEGAIMASVLSYAILVVIPALYEVLTILRGSPEFGGKGK